MSDNATPEHPRWGYHGEDVIERDERGKILKLSKHNARVLGGTHKQEIVFYGPPYRIITADTITDEERDRLESELGAKFSGGVNR